MFDLYDLLLNKDCIIVVISNYYEIRECRNDEN